MQPLILSYKPQRDVIVAIIKERKVLMLRFFSLADKMVQPSYMMPKDFQFFKFSRDTRME